MPQTPNFGLSVDDIHYNPPNAAGLASRLTLYHFADLSQPGSFIPDIAPHNRDVRQPQDTSEWPPAVIVDLVYTVAAMKVWSPKSFIKYVREQSSDAYYPEGEDQDEDNDNVLDSSGSSHVDAHMGDQTTGRSGYALRSRRRTSNIPPKESSFADLMNGVYALWMQSSRMGKKMTEDAHAQGGPKNLKTTRGRFFSLRPLLPSPSYLPNKVCFRPKMVCFSHPSFEEISGCAPGGP